AAAADDARDHLQLTGFGRDQPGADQQRESAVGVAVLDFRQARQAEAAETLAAAAFEQARDQPGLLALLAVTRLDPVFQRADIGDHPLAPAVAANPAGVDEMGMEGVAEVLRRLLQAATHLVVHPE